MDIVSDPEVVSNVLQEQYVKSFSCPGASSLVLCRNVCDIEGEQREFSFHEADMEWAIDQLRGEAASEPDEIPSVLLKRCRAALAHPLTMLWQESLSSSEMPAALKRGLITPIFKGGDKRDPASYRPITLTSHVIKLFK